MADPSFPCCNVIENPDLTATACDGTTTIEPHMRLTYVCDTCGGQCGVLVHPQCSAMSDTGRHGSNPEP